jgi:hypothetical protein
MGESAPGQSAEMSAQSKRFAPYEAGEMPVPNLQ